MIHNIIEMISKMTNSNDDGAHVDKSLVGEAVLWVHLLPPHNPEVKKNFQIVIKPSLPQPKVTNIQLNLKGRVSLNFFILS